jgi:hypothetical protein
LYGRIVWGLHGFSKDTSDIVAKILTEHLGRAKTDVHHAASVYGLHREVLEKEPPADWGLAHVRQQYPEDLFVLPVSAREPLQPKDTDALWSELVRALPTGITAERLPTWDTNAKDICYARIRGKEQAETVRSAVANHPRLRAGEIRPLPLATQLYLEEKHGVTPAGGPGTLSPSSPDASTSAQSPAVAQTPGPIQRRINDAAPGATIRLEPGVYKERLTIEKPLTLEGAGWDKTTILVESRAAEEYERIQQTLRTKPSAAEVERLRKQYTEEVDPLVLGITGARGVVVRGIKFS